jgi:exodeoxyribonuclease VII large subunit
VADLRAATPSAAAEIITEGVFASSQFLSEAGGRLRDLARQRLADKQGQVDRARQRLGRMHPRRRLNEWLQRLDDLQGGLLRCVNQGARQRRLAWRHLSDRLLRVRPAVLLKQRREVVQQARQHLRERAQLRLRETRSRLETARARLLLLGPEQVLARGYSITMDAESGDVLREAAKAKPGQQLRTRLKTGQIRSRVEPGD